MGAPCPEGGAVSVLNMPSLWGPKNSILMYDKQINSFSVPREQWYSAQLPPEQLSWMIAGRIDTCIPPGEVLEAPFSLESYAECIAHVNFHAEVQEPVLPIRGVAVLPYRTRALESIWDRYNNCDMAVPDVSFVFLLKPYIKVASEGIIQGELSLHVIVFTPSLQLV